MIRIYTQSERGLRQQNQDSITARTYSDGSGVSEVTVAAVADGLGSLKDSGLCSRYIRQKIEDFAEEKKLSFCEDRFEDIVKELTTLVKSIHKELIFIASEKGYRYGSTLTLLCVVMNSYICVQVGDSRMYLLSDGVLRLITTDQTLAEKTREEGLDVKTGDLKRKESMLLQCVGQGDLDPTVYTGAVNKNAVFLLCSDGLSNTLSMQEIKMRMENPSERSLSDLFDTAKRRGEKDNVSGLIIDYQGV